MRFKSFSAGIALILLFSNAAAQVTDAEKQLKTVNADTIMGWKKGGVFALNFAQTSLNNWAAGGQNSVAVNGIFSAFANYKKDKSAWDNTLDLGYGLLKQGKEGDVMKTDDKIDFLSKYGREAFKNVYYSALLNFRTQMRPGYKYPDTEKGSPISFHLHTFFWRQGSILNQILIFQLSLLPLPPNSPLSTMTNCLPPELSE